MRTTTRSASSACRTSRRTSISARLPNAATQSGLDLLGYANQAQFLINCGITDVLAATPANDAAAYLPLAAQAQKLVSPAEMGELFKVIAFGRNHRVPLAGFASGNKQGLL